MWISYILFFEPGWVEWLERRARRLLRRPPAPQAAAPDAARPRALSLGHLALTAFLVIALATTIWGSLDYARDLTARLVPPMPQLAMDVQRQIHLASSWRMIYSGSIHAWHRDPPAAHAPLLKHCVPARNECVPARNECVPARNECVPARNECVPARNECAPARNECAPPRKDCWAASRSETLIPFTNDKSV
jgi:hypothetical protein